MHRSVSSGARGARFLEVAWLVGLPAAASIAAARLVGAASAAVRLSPEVARSFAFATFWMLVRFGGGTRTADIELLVPRRATIASLIAVAGTAIVVGGVVHQIEREPPPMVCGARSSFAVLPTLDAVGTLISVLIGAAIEESVFRAWLPTRLARVMRYRRALSRWWSGCAPVLLSQLAFSLAHLPGRAFAMGDAVPQTGALIAPFLKGLTLFALARVSGGIAAPAIAHWAHNWFASSAAPTERWCASYLSAGCLSAIAGAIVLVHSYRSTASRA